MFTYNLRFPGQYYDVETGKHYNYFRDYDPVVGRYLQSDPLGLIGGRNLFAFGGGEPLVNSDSLGLYTGVDDSVFAIGGALVGIAGQAIADRLSGQSSGWEDYAGAAIGGAASGESLLYTGPIVAGLVGGAATNAAKQWLKNQTESQCGYNFTSFVTDTIAGGLFGLIPGTRVAGVTAGRGSWNSIFQQMRTKLASGLIRSVKLKTAFKMAGGRAIDMAVVPGMAAGSFAGVYAEPLVPGYNDACSCYASK